MNKENLSLGEKIKDFRKRANISQFQLELEIGLAQGSLSRIESGEVNPTKETILNISNSLNLSSEEVADLFDIDLSKTTKSNLDIYIKSIRETSENLKKAQSLDEVVSIVFDKLVLQLGYNFAGLFLLNGNILKLEKFSLPKIINNLVNKLLKTDLLNISYDITNEEHKRCLVVTPVLDGKVSESEHVHEFSIPKYLDEKKGLAFKKLAGLKLILGIPLKYEDTYLGALILSTQNPNFSERDKDVLQVFADEISKAIYNTK